MQFRCLAGKLPNRSLHPGGRSKHKYRRNAWTLSVSLRDYTRLSPIQDPIGVEFISQDCVAFNNLSVLRSRYDIESIVDDETSDFGVHRVELFLLIRSRCRLPKWNFACIECEFSIFPYQGFIWIRPDLLVPVIRRRPAPYYIFWRINLACPSKFYAVYRSHVAIDCLLDPVLFDRHRPQHQLAGPRCGRPETHLVAPRSVAPLRYTACFR